MAENHAEVIIIGAGPVGLFLGCCLERLEVPFLILEKDQQPSEHTRSIGLHPPSLERLERLGLAERFLEKGVRVEAGKVFLNGRYLGTLSFRGCPEPFNFVLSLPQHDTEGILEEHLQKRAPGCLRRGLEVVNAAGRDAGVETEAVDGTGARLRFSGLYAIGCDGKSSRLRDLAGVEFVEKPYPDAFALGDFDDRTGFGAAAAIFLGTAGLVESFPLPGGRRRWVMKTERFEKKPALKDFRQRVRERTGHDLAGLKPYRLNSFGIQACIAAAFFKGRVALAGDAAHVVSPIGGQGMNLGWLDAWDLASALARILKKGTAPEEALRHYERRARRRAKQACRRAEFNLFLGREHRRSLLRRALLWLILHPPLRRRFARFFTMRGLK
ncbi:MAG: FAD-dependent monooxygenase [Planctomycetes bacterium]|nr:FAD-dependent monooxygenase [Planctomycetota bacterium]